MFWDPRGAWCGFDCTIEDQSKGTNSFVVYRRPERTHWGGSTLSIRLVVECGRQRGGIRSILGNQGGRDPSGSHMWKVIDETRTLVLLGSNDNNRRCLRRCGLGSRWRRFGMCVLMHFVTAGTTEVALGHMSWINVSGEGVKIQGAKRLGGHRSSQRGGGGTERAKQTQVGWSHRWELTQPRMRVMAGRKGTTLATNRTSAADDTLCNMLHCHTHKS